ncbi:hypothetical protein Bca4012_005607 [Brassica carinata]
MNHEPLPPIHISLHDSVHALEETELQGSLGRDLSKPTAHLTHNQICSRQNTQDLRENDCRNPSNPKSRPISVNPPHTARQNSRQPSSPPVSDSRSFFDLQSTKHLTAGYGHRQESKIK